MKLFLVIASVAMMCLVECSAQDLLASSYGGGFSYGGGVPSFAAPSYAAPSYAAPGYAAPNFPSYGSVPSYGGGPSYGGVPSFPIPSYGGSSSYGGLSSFGLGVPGVSGVSHGSDVATSIPCMCAPSPPKICGSDSITYAGWCNFKCGVTNKPDLKLAYLGECRVMGRSNNNNNENHNNDN